MAREGLFPDVKLEKIAKLPGAAAPRPHHFAKILERNLKGDG